MYVLIGPVTDNHCQLLYIQCSIYPPYVTASTFTDFYRFELLLTDQLSLKSGSVFILNGKLD